MPLGGLGLSLFVGWFRGRMAILTNNGTPRNEYGIRLMILLCRTLTPVLILIILGKGLGLLG